MQMANASPWQNNTYHPHAIFFFCNKTVSNSGEVNIWIQTREQRAFLSDLEGISPSQSTVRKLIYGVEIEFLCVLHWQIRMSWALLEAIVIGVLSSSFKESPCIAVSLGKRCPRATKLSRRGLKRRKKRITIKGYVKYKETTSQAVNIVSRVILNWLIHRTIFQGSEYFCAIKFLSVI